MMTPTPSPRAIPSAFESKERQFPVCESACTLENIR